MNLEQVTQTLDALANGVDPATGSRIPIDAFHSPDVVRALFMASNLLRGHGRRQAAGSRWTEEEEAKVARAFDAGQSIADIAREHKRTKGAITSRLVKLGRLDPATVTLRERKARLAS
jgi:DNA-binding NarL/FixJ family response regulator